LPIGDTSDPVNEVRRLLHLRSRVAVFLLYAGPGGGQAIDNTIPGSDEESRSREANVQRPYLYLAFQCNQPLASSARYAIGQLKSVKIGRGTARATQLVPRHKSLRIELSDSWVSSSHARLDASLGRWTLEDQGSKNGTFVNGAKVKRAILADGDLVEIGRTFFIFRSALGIAEDEPMEADSGQLAPAARGLATLVPVLSRQFDALAQIARSDVSVMIQGESGTGKELIARAAHLLSQRSGPFVAVNCGAIPSELVASELFGHQRGAFSGAIQARPGWVRSADHGTLFLDEIGDLPLPLQSTFLRVLQERQVVPVGDSRPIDVNIRLCSASHRDLETLVAQKKLRGDLFARLSGFSLRLPPLRDRREDLGILISAMLRRTAPDNAERIAFHRRAARALFLYGWPLNIRELEKCLEAAVILAKGGRITLDLLPESLRAALDALPEVAEQRRGGALTAKDLQLRERLLALLHEHRGKVSAVARALKKDRIQVRRWLKRYEIDVQEYRGDDSESGS
jgi:DNA-binding NtrC family response regulator